MAIGELEIDSLSMIYACAPQESPPIPPRGTYAQLESSCAWLVTQLDLG